MTEAAPEAPSRIGIFHLLLIVPWVAVVINAYERLIDNSFLWHVRAGELQLDGLSVLTSDPFSFTAFGEAWRTQSWLADLGYGWAEGRFGVEFFAPMVLTVSVITFVAIGLIAYRSSGDIAATSIVLVLSAIIVPRFLVPRPTLFSVPLFLAVILAWDRARLRWTVPFLLWLWAALHGSFVIGFVYIGLRIVQKREWRSIPVVLVSGVATLMTAHGLGVVETLIAFFDVRPYLSLISEWRPPDLLEPDLIPFVLAIVLIVFGAARGKVRADSLWIFAPFLLLALSAERSVGTAWLAFIPLLAPSVAALEPARLSRRGFSRPVAVVVMIVILALPFIVAESGDLDDSRFPVAASEHLDDVRTFHGDATGGYLIWTEGLSEGVYIDDRAELYGSRLEEMVDVRSLAVDWRPVFARDGVEQALLESSLPLVDALTDAGWSRPFADDNFVVLRSPGT